MNKLAIAFIGLALSAITASAQLPEQTIQWLKLASTIQYGTVTPPPPSYWTDTNSYLYLLETTNSTTYTTDTSGSNRTFLTQGTPSGVITGTNQFGRIEYALSLNGVNDDLYRNPSDPYSTFSNGTNDRPFTVGCWINVPDMPSVGPFRTIFTKGYVGYSYWIHILTGAGSTNFIRMRLYSGTSYRSKLFPIGVNNTNQWINIVITYDGRGGSFAYDGMLCYTNGYSITTGTAFETNGAYVAMDKTERWPALGIDANTAAYFFKGLIDHFFVSSNLFSQASVQDLTTYTHPTNNIRTRP